MHLRGGGQHVDDFNDGDQESEEGGEDEVEEEVSVECEHPSDLFTVAGSNLMNEELILFDANPPVDFEFGSGLETHFL